MRSAALVASAVSAAVLTVTLAACGSGGHVSGGGQGAGKQLFVDRCGSCHVLADAGTTGVVGPSLDDAFAQAREDGMTSSTFTQVVSGQIRYAIVNPSTGVPGMPGVDDTLPRCDDVEDGSFCVDDQDQAVGDIAAYVGAVAGTGVTAERPTDGKSVFTASCGACHTLTDAGTSGTVGPNLDDARPPRDLVADIVANGRGAMPALGGQLDDAQIQAVAEYVSSVAGR